MKPLIDGDILRYEIGFAAEVGWKAKVDDKEAIPPFNYVEEVLLSRIETICQEVKADEPYQIYLSGNNNFRDKIATVKPYKANRKANKPWHFNNLTVYLSDVLNAKVVDGMEADDAMAIDHISSNNSTIICSRDKDLRQLPGWFYSWELGKQASFGPINIEREGSLTLTKDKKLTGTGLAFFYAQCLIGDSVDNIPGCPGVGPVNTYENLSTASSSKEMLEIVLDRYYQQYGPQDFKIRLLEQGRLLWLCRRLNEDGTPQMWEIGLED